VALSVVMAAHEPNDFRSQQLSSAKSQEIRGVVGGVRNHAIDGSDKFELVARPGQLLKIAFGPGTGGLVKVRAAGATGAVGPKSMTFGPKAHNPRSLEVFSGSGRTHFVVSTAGVSRPHSYDLVVTHLATDPHPIDFRVLPVDPKDAAEILPEGTPKATRVVTVRWQSSTGKLADLSAVSFRVRLTYSSPYETVTTGPGQFFTRPYPFENPSGAYENPDPWDNGYHRFMPTYFYAKGTAQTETKIKLEPPPVAGQALVFDRYYEVPFDDRYWTGTLRLADGKVIPLTTVSYTETRQYQWRAPYVNHGDFQDIGEPIQIVRTIEYLGLHNDNTGSYNLYLYTIEVPNLKILGREAIRVYQEPG
jgi:hypothetical protein